MRESREVITYREFLQEAARQTLFAPPEQLESLAFPFWQKAVHAILVLNGCQCFYQDGKCFLDLPREKQIRLHSGGRFSFEGFVVILTETRNLILSEAIVVSVHT
mgnify:FL=1